MFIRFLLILFTAVVTFSFSPVATRAHPSDGYEPNDLDPSYGTDQYGYNPEWEINDLYFVRPYPNQDTLSDAEKYVLAGTTASDQGYGLNSWYETLFTYVCLFEAITGSIPTEMSQVVIDTIFQDHSLTEQMLELATSPISGQLPKLNSEKFSPGDLYLRKLTEEEKLHFAELSPRWKLMWYDNLWFDGLWYEGIMESEDFCPEPITMLTDVYYMRIYGEDSEIMSRIIFNWQ